MHSGIPIDAADFQQIAGALNEGLEKMRAQRLHRLVKGGGVLFFVGREPFTVVIQANTPEKIHGFGSKSGKHIGVLFLYNIGD